MAESAVPLLSSLKSIVGGENVLTAEADVAPYVTDWRDAYHGRARAVVRQTVAAMPKKQSCKCSSSLAHAIITERDKIPRATRQKLSLILIAVELITSGEVLRPPPGISYLRRDVDQY